MRGEIGQRAPTVVAQGYKFDVEDAGLVLAHTAHANRVALTQVAVKTPDGREWEQGEVDCTLWRVCGMRLAGIRGVPGAPECQAHCQHSDWQRLQLHDWPCVLHIWPAR